VEKQGFCYRGTHQRVSVCLNDEEEEFHAPLKEKSPACCIRKAITIQEGKN
jgi:hypothetical protein